MTNKHKEVGFVSHLVELRKRLINSIITCTYEQKKTVLCRNALMYYHTRYV